MINKKDLVILANVLNKNMYKTDGEFGSELFGDIVNLCKNSNPNFDESKFRDAVFKDK